MVPNRPLYTSQKEPKGHHWIALHFLNKVRHGENLDLRLTSKPNNFDPLPSIRQHTEQAAAAFCKELGREKTLQEVFEGTVFGQWPTHLFNTSIFCEGD